MRCDDNHGDANGGTKVLKANVQTDIEIDKDAKWLKKGNKNIFGYKSFLNCSKKQHLTNLHE